MNFLITGGAGFLGTALANQLAFDGHGVRVLDDLSNGDPSRLRSDIMFTRGSVTDVPRLWSLLQDVDCVYHLAARVSVAESVLYPSDYNEVNVGGTVNLMEAMRDAGVKRVVLASSGAVYGAQWKQPVTESDLPQPDSPYAVSKFSAEQYVKTIGELWGIETVALRIFNAFGENQPLPVSHAPVLPRFLQQALTGGSVVIFGNGSQSRDFVYLTDVVDALVKTATVKDIDQLVINVGSGIETTVDDLVDTIEAVIGRKVNRIYNPSKHGGVKQLVANMRRADALLDFQPKVTLKAGIQRMLQQDSRFSTLAAANKHGS